jgi:hypothetical protein
MMIVIVIHKVNDNVNFPALERRKPSKNPTIMLLNYLKRTLPLQVIRKEGSGIRGSKALKYDITKQPNPDNRINRK